MTDRRRQTGRQTFFFRVIGSSSTSIQECLAYGDVIVVEVIRVPLFHKGFLGVIDISLCDVVLVGTHNLWEARSRAGCQGPQRSCTGDLSTTSWKMKLTGRRENRLVREKKMRKKKWMEMSEQSERHTTMRMRHEMGWVSADPNLSHACARMNVNHCEKWTVWGVVFTLPVGCSKLLAAVNDLTATNLLKKLESRHVWGFVKRRHKQRISPFYHVVLHLSSVVDFLVNCHELHQESLHCHHDVRCRQNFSTLSPRTSFINLVNGSNLAFSSSNFFFSSSSPMSKPYFVVAFSFFPTNSFNCQLLEKKLDDECHWWYFQNGTGLSCLSPDSWCRRLNVVNASLKSERSLTGPVFPDSLRKIHQFFLYRKYSSCVIRQVKSFCASLSIWIQTSSVRSCSSWDSRNMGSFKKRSWIHSKFLLTDLFLKFLAIWWSLCSLVFPQRWPWCRPFLNDIILNWKKVQCTLNGASAGFTFFQEVPASAINDALISVKKAFFALHFGICLAQLK